MSQTSRQYQRPRWLQSIYPFTSSTSNLQCWNIFRYVSKCLQTYSLHFKIRHGKCTDMLDRNRMKHKVKNAAVTRWTKDSRKSRGGLDCFVSCFITFDNAIKLKHRQNLDSYSDWKFYITRLSSSLSKTYLDLIDKINKSLDKRVLSPPHYCCLDYQQAAL